jgi:hypothetical protein
MILLFYENDTYIICLIFVLLLLLLMFLYKIKIDKNKKNQQPKNIGFSLPIIGHLIYLKNEPYKKLLKWSYRYGNIYEINLGNQKAIILNSTNVIRDALIKCQDTFTNRPRLYMLEKTLKGLGIVSSQYTINCIENRNLLCQFLHKKLKFKTDYLEHYINNSIKVYLNEFKIGKINIISSNNLKINIHYILAQRMLIFLYGQDCDNKDFLVNIVEKVDENFKNSAIVSAFNFIPITRFLFRSSIFKNVKIVNDFLSKLTNDRLKYHEPGMNDTFVDSYIEKIRISGKKDVFNVEQLNSLVQDLFLSGTETLSNTILWSFVYVAYYKNYQKRVHDEIDGCIGIESTISFDNAKLKTPFIFAFLYETMRYHCAGPILIPRSNAKDVKFNGFDIPKDSMILLNMWSCMRDPLYWENPNEFNPMRFLDQNGQIKIDNPAMLAFSAGKRACLGEELARTEMFLIFTNILQKLRLNIVNKPDGVNFGLNISPKNILLSFEFR